MNWSGLRLKTSILPENEIRAEILRQPVSGGCHQPDRLLTLFEYLDLHDAAIVAQRPRHAGEHFALVALDIDLDRQGSAGERDEIIEADDLDVVAFSVGGSFDDLGQADIALRSGQQPKTPRCGAERHGMDFKIGVEQAVDQEIGAEMSTIAAIGFEQDRARHQAVFMRTHV